MTWVLPLLEVAVAGAGIAEMAGAFGGGSKPPAPPQAPNQDDANKKAAALVADQRATLLASGGITDMTGGLGVLTGSDLTKSTLTGG